MHMADALLSPAVGWDAVADVTAFMDIIKIKKME